MTHKAKLQEGRMILSTTVILPDWVHDRLVAEAEKELRSIPNMIAAILRERYNATRPQ